MPAHVRTKLAAWEELREVVPNVDRVRQIMCLRRGCTHGPLDILDCARLLWLKGFLRQAGWRVRFPDEVRDIRHGGRSSSIPFVEYRRGRQSYTVPFFPTPRVDAHSSGWMDSMPLYAHVAEHWCKPLGHDHPEKDTKICAMLVRGVVTLLDAGFDPIAPEPGVSPWC